MNTKLADKVTTPTSQAFSSYKLHQFLMMLSAKRLQRHCHTWQKRNSLLYFNILILFRTITFLLTSLSLSSGCLPPYQCDQLNSYTLSACFVLRFVRHWHSGLALGQLEPTCLSPCVCVFVHKCQANALLAHRCECAPRTCLAKPGQSRASRRQCSIFIVSRWVPPKVIVDAFHYPVTTHTHNHMKEI